MTKLQQISMALAGGVMALAQTGSEPVNTGANPYATVSNFFELPAGRTWGSTSAVEVDRDGTLLPRSRSVSPSSPRACSR